MKTFIGSLQRRGSRYYLVIRRNGRQRWLALKTDKLPLARMRAAQIALRDPNDEIAWLEQLVREGERARRFLVRKKICRELTWRNLSEWCWQEVDVVEAKENRACHERWLSLLSDEALLSSVDHAIPNLPF